MSGAPKVTSVTLYAFMKGKCERCNYQARAQQVVHGCDLLGSAGALQRVGVWPRASQAL